MVDYALGDDPTERIKIIVESGDLAGRVLDFWQSAAIDRSLADLSGRASVAVGRGKLSERGYDRFPLAPGDKIRLLIGEDPILTGWVGKRNTTRSADEHGLNIQIRSLSCDLVDCSAVNRPGQWHRARLSRIGGDLAAGFGLPVAVAAGHDDIVPNFEIEQGEAIFDALERLARGAGLILRESAAGVVTLAPPGLTKAVVVLLHLNGASGGPDPRNNVLESDGEKDETKRFSRYEIKGQGEGGRAAAAALGVSFDHAVARFRPKIITAPSKADDAYCRRLAGWEAARRAGEAEKLVLGVRGWRQAPGGALWDVDIVADVQDDDAEIYGPRLISAVSWRIDDKKGRLAQLTLQPVEAWSPKPFMDRHVGGAGGGKWASVAAAVKSGGAT